METITRSPFAEHATANGSEVLVVVLTGLDVVVDPTVLLVVLTTVVVVVLEGFSSAVTRESTQPSTAARISSWLFLGRMQSLPGPFSSFSTQPWAGSPPPSSFALAWSTHPSLLGSAGLPGVCAFA